MDIAAARPEPIPFYAEMSSTNPVFILPGALRERGAKIAAGLHASFTLGAGQFCTKPGMVFLPEGSEASTFVGELQNSVNGSSPFTLLTGVIRSSYNAGLDSRRGKSKVKAVADKSAGSNAKSLTVDAALFETDAQTFLKDPDLSEEIFGPGDSSGPALKTRRSSASRERVGRTLDSYDPRHRTGPSRLRRPDRNTGTKSWQVGFQRFSNRRGSLTRHGSRWSVSLDIRWAIHVGRDPGHFPLRSTCLLPRVPQCGLAGRFERQQSSGHLADGGWRNDQGARSATSNRITRAYETVHQDCVVFRDSSRQHGVRPGSARRNRRN